MKLELEFGINQIEEMNSIILIYKFICTNEDDFCITELSMFTYILDALQDFQDAHEKEIYDETGSRLYKKIMDVDK